MDYYHGKKLSESKLDESITALNELELCGHPSRPSHEEEKTICIDILEFCFTIFFELDALIDHRCEFELLSMVF